MRSIWFSLIETTVKEVEQALLEFGAEQLEPGRWNFPKGTETVFYISCTEYEWVDELGLRDEYKELLVAIGGQKPSVELSVDVSGRHPGDDEVRLISQFLLNRFKGFAFDDYLAYSHAWTLEEILSGVKVNGLHFFDYQGYFEKTKKFGEIPSNQDAES